MECEYGLVYYDIENNIIFTSGYLDAHFFGLTKGVYWNRVMVLGPL